MTGSAGTAPSPTSGTTPAGVTTASDTGTVDACAGGPEGRVRLGVVDRGVFTPWEEGADAPMGEDAGGVFGLPFGLEVSGLDQTDQLSALVDLYVEDEIFQSAFGSLITDCTDGVGTGIRFIPFDEGVDADDLTGKSARLEVTLADKVDGKASTELSVILR